MKYASVKTAAKLASVPLFLALLSSPVYAVAVEVPEPSSFMLLGLGLAGLALSRRKSKK